MIWQQLILQAPSDQADSLSELLDQHQAQAITLKPANDDQPLFEPPLGTMPLWDSMIITALFAVDTPLDALINKLQLSIHPHTLQHRIETLEEQDWQKNCTDAFSPKLFAERLWVYPSWQPAPDDSLPRLMLDPGLAFGTGSHATTTLCLNWLTHKITKNSCAIDYGCGSGILALAAAKLGANKIWAVDNDPQALQATLDNAQRNQVTLDAVMPENLPQNVQADYLVANILANPLMDLAASFAQHVKHSGKLALSGILAEQANDVKSVYEQWFAMEEAEIQEGWACLHGTRRS